LQFHAYRTWLDEDARAGSVLEDSMEDRFAADIVGFERTHQMWSFLCQKYESFLRQGDTIVEDFFD
jgi:hypothetical protein